MLATEANDPMLAMDRTEPWEAIDRTESVDHSDRRDRPFEVGDRRGGTKREAFTTAVTIGAGLWAHPELLLAFETRPSDHWSKEPPAGWPTEESAVAGVVTQGAGR